MNQSSSDQSDSMKPKIIELIALRHLGLGRQEDAITWAVSAIEQGVDSPSLRTLAGLTVHTNPFEFDSCLQEVASELGYDESSHDQWVSDYVGFIAGQIVNGDLAPKEGCLEMKRIANASGREDLIVWIGFAEEFYVADVAHVNLVKLVEEIKREAKALVQIEG